MTRADEGRDADADGDVATVASVFTSLMSDDVRVARLGELRVRRETGLRARLAAAAVRDDLVRRGVRLALRAVLRAHEDAGHDEPRTTTTPPRTIDRHELLRRRKTCPTCCSGASFFGGFVGLGRLPPSWPPSRSAEASARSPALAGGGSAVASRAAAGLCRSARPPSRPRAPSRSACRSTRPGP